MKIKLMYRGIELTAEPKMNDLGEILTGADAGAIEICTPITGWDTRKDVVHSKVRTMIKNGLKGRFAIESQNMVKVTQDLRTISYCSACSGQHFKLPFIQMEVPVEVKGEMMTHSAICPIKRVEIFARESK